MTPITFEAPLRTKSPNGQHGHWSARARRVALERKLIAFAFPRGSQGLLNRFPSLSVVVTLTRIAPSRGLDDDNLSMAGKGCRDEVAKQLGLDDRDPRIEWKYAQSKGKWGVRVTIEARP
jgi:hypothetical protein